MFDTMKTARKIKEARIALNMTQMNLADAMEVSYQAVSNWERGNSMPDIAKLEQLCQILQISMEELLGTDTSQVINKVMQIGKGESTDDDPVTIEDIQSVAPILPPDNVEKLLDDNLNQQPKEKLNLKAIVELAPYLDDEYLDALVMNADTESDMSGIIALAPFLSDETLDRLVEKMQPLGSLSELCGLAPFLSNKALSTLVLNADTDSDMSGITALAPFLDKSTLGMLAEKLLKNSSKA